MKKTAIIIIVFAIAFISLPFVMYSELGGVCYQYFSCKADDVARWSENLKYNEKWIIGKHAEEITEKYGEFDLVKQDEATGVIMCGYRTKKETSDVLFNDVIPEEFFVVYFDSDNVACKTEKNWIDWKKYI